MTPNPAESAESVEIAADALSVAMMYQGYSDETRRAEIARNRSLNAQYVRKIFAALEAAGYRIVHPKNVTPDMAYAAFKSVEPVLAESTEPNEEDWIVALRAAIAAAPTYATPAAHRRNR